jgi:serine protease Do
MLLVRLFSACLIFGCSSAVVLADVPAAGKASVLQLTAHHTNGRVTQGSAVVIAPGKLVTNAHVTHGAVRIEVAENGQVLPAKLAAHDASRDLCLLEAAAVSAPAVLSLGHLAPGRKVYAIGFPADQGLVMTSGDVVALHQYADAEVIQASTPFDYGASGGGLFDEQGRLVGILTFKARAGGAFHFAVPITWLEQIGRGGHLPGSRSAVPFWQRATEALPYFLRAASLEATRNWSALAALAHDWSTAEPSNPGAWRALAKARAHTTIGTAVTDPLSSPKLSLTAPKLTGTAATVPASD